MALEGLQLEDVYVRLQSLRRQFFGEGLHPLGAARVAVGPLSKWPRFPALDQCLADEKATYGPIEIRRQIERSRVAKEVVFGKTDASRPVGIHVPFSGPWNSPASLSNDWQVTTFEGFQVDRDGEPV